MSERHPRGARRLHWQVICLDPQLLQHAQAVLRASGPSDAIERALRLAVSQRGAARAHPVHLPLH
jgi:hypothetical protein